MLFSLGAITIKVKHQVKMGETVEGDIIPTLPPLDRLILPSHDAVSRTLSVSAGIWRV